MIAVTFQITEQDIEQYALLSGDDNPIHLDQQEAIRQGFKDKLAHGMLTMAKIWSVLSQEILLPYQQPKNYELTFLSPVYAEDKVTLEIRHINEAYRIEIKNNGKVIGRGSFVI